MAYTDVESRGNLVLSAVTGRWRLCVMLPYRDNIAGQVSPPGMSRVLGAIGTNNLNNGSFVPTYGSATLIGGTGAPPDQVQIYCDAANLPVIMFIGV